MKRKKYFGSNLKMYKNVAQTESYLKELADRTRELCMQNPDMELVGVFTRRDPSQLTLNVFGNSVKKYGSVRNPSWCTEYVLGG